MVFFGDNAWEKIKNIGNDMRLFRDGKFEIYTRAGNAHPFGGAPFREAVAEAVAYESAARTGDAPTVPLTVATAPKPPPVAAVAAVKAQPTPRWYGRGSKTASSQSSAAADAKAATEAAEAEEAKSKAQRELDNLAFGAPGRKAIYSVEQEMTERERRKLARAIELSVSVSGAAGGASEGLNSGVQHLAASAGKGSKAAGGGRRQRFSIAKRFPIRDVLFDVLAPPPPNTSVGGEEDCTNSVAVANASAHDRQRKCARPQRAKRTGVLFEMVRNEKKPV